MLGLITMTDEETDLHFLDWQHLQHLKNMAIWRQERLNAECELIVLEGLAKYDPQHEREMRRMARWWPHLADRINTRMGWQS